MFSRLIIAALLLVCACSPPGLDTSVLADEDYDTVRAAMSPCPSGVVGQFDTSWEFGLAGVQAWYEVEEYDGRPIPVVSSTATPSEFEAISVASGEKATLDLVGPVGSDAVLEWGVNEASGLYLGVTKVGLGDGGVADFITVVMAELADGSPFFPGECAEELVGDSLRESIGEQAYSTFVQDAITMVGSELEAYVTTAQ